MQEEWDALGEKFQHTIDQRGRGIDPGIFETVVVFQALGLHTVASCEGHLDDGRGLLFPYVDIEAPGIDAFKEALTTVQLKVTPMEQEIEQLRSVNAHRSIIHAAYSRIGPLYNQRKELRQQARMVQCEERTRLIHYLGSFYRDREVPLDRRLMITVKTALGRTRLASQAREDFYVAAPYSLQKQKLQEAQEEMQALTQFLKTLYFSKAPKTTMSGSGAETLFEGGTARARWWGSLSK